MTRDVPNVPASAGALTFCPDGTLFVADNKNCAIFAYATQSDARQAPVKPFFHEHIDRRVGEALAVAPGQLTVGGLAVHPLTRDIYISFSVWADGTSEPSVVRVTPEGHLSLLDLSTMVAVHVLSNVPDETATVKSRVGDWPVPPNFFYEKKARTPLRSMAIVDMKVHRGELYVSGVSNLEFASTLRRIPIPFDGSSSDTQIQIYHVAHGIYETRAPIRAMGFAEIDGQDTLIAAYACSPVVLIPLSELRSGAKVIGKTIGDMGNGQPISLVPYRLEGQDMVLITNLARGPMVMPVSGFAGAKGYTPETTPAPFMFDLSPHMPIGPVGKQVMFVGSSLRADLFSEDYFVSLTRESDTGGLTLETLPVGPLPIRLEKIWVEYDFPGATFNLKNAV
jgi:hypothetical protein